MKVFKQFNIWSRKNLCDCPIISRAMDPCNAQHNRQILQILRTSLTSQTICEETNELCNLSHISDIYNWIPVSLAPAHISLHIFTTKYKNFVKTLRLYWALLRNTVIFNCNKQTYTSSNVTIASIWLFILNYICFR